MPLTVAACGCFDAAAIKFNTLAGLVVIGVSLMYLEHLIADEQ
jgi:hypothetical protein